MAPTRLGDGTSIGSIRQGDGTGIAEVRTGDGDVVFTAGPGNPPPDLANLGSHYAARLLTGVSDGQTVNTFTDQAGSFDATLVGGSAVLDNDGLNGQPSVDYTSGGVHDTGFNQNTNDDRTIYMVVSTDLDGSNNFLYGAFDDSPANRSYIGDDGSNYFLGYGDTAHLGSGTGTPPTGNNINSYVADSGTFEAYINDSTSASSTFTYSGVGTMGFSDSIGARNNLGDQDNEPSNSVFAEVLRYETAHDDTTRQQVVSFLNGIYSVF